MTYVGTKVVRCLRVTPDHTLLRLALQNESEQVWTRPAGTITLEVRGLPGARFVRGHCIEAAPNALTYSFTEVDGRALNSSFSLTFLRPPQALQVDDESIEGKGGSRWYPVEPGLLLREPQGLDDAGLDIMAVVNTTKKPWKLECDCGRVRYANRAGVRQVDRCRVCTETYRRAYKVAWQRRRRAENERGD